MAQKIYTFKFLVLVFLLLCFFSYSILAETITGHVMVIDADTLKIGKNRIRLLGIDAPETKQTCFIKNEEWECGKQATIALKKLINSNIVRCETTGKDQYKRYIAECYVINKNINQWLVQNGWAIAYRYYSKKFVDDEKIARINKLGIWQGNFIEPYLYRKKNK